MRKRLSVPLLVPTVLFILVASLPAAAHHVGHEVARGEAVVVSLAYGDGSPLDYERYEVSAEGEATPYQVGSTDAQGRIVFLPDRTRTWRVRVFSEDGHGADFTFEAGPAAATAAEPDAVAPEEEAAVPQEATSEAVAVDKPFIERFAGPVAGVGIIFGLFGLFALFVRKRN